MLRNEDIERGAKWVFGIIIGLLCVIAVLTGVILW